MRRCVARSVVLVALLGMSVAVPPGEPAAAGPQAPPTPAQAPGGPTVTVYGEAGTFGSLASVATTASGQSLATEAVPGWTFPAGREFWANAHTSDGTIVVAGGDHSRCQPCQTASESAIAAFDPATNDYEVTNLTTTVFDANDDPVPGFEEPPTPGMVSDTVGDGPEQRGGTSVSDLAAFDSGDAVAFVAWTDHIDHDVDQYGIWPAFGILTEVDGTWQVANGPGWMNQWTGRELRNSRPEDDRDEIACPEDIRISTTGLPPNQTVARYPDHSGCAALNEIELLPPTGIPDTYDFVVTQYGDDDDDQHPAMQGGVMVLRVTGPDAQGHYTTKVMDKYTYPLVHDPTTPDDPDDYIGLSVMGVMADPSGAATPTDQRFVVNFDHWQQAGNPAQPSVFQELSYNAVTGDITPRSAPLLPGDLQANGNPYAFKHVAYAADGTLYAARFGDWFAGGKLAVYPVVGGARPLERIPGCMLEPGVALEDHTTEIGGRTVWGRTCKPYYDIVQPEALPWAIPEVNPATGDVIMVGIHGRVLVIRPSGSGENMGFDVGAPLDTSFRLLSHTVSGNSFMMSGAHFGSIDADGRLWLSVGEARNEACEQVTYPRYLVDDPATPTNEGALCISHDALPSNSWLYAIDLEDLIAPPAVELPATPGQLAGIHAETTATTATVKRPATAADFEFDPARYVKRCTAGACTYLQTGDGFYLADDSHGTWLGGDWGHRGGPLDYTVEVPSAGCYRLGYYVMTYGSSAYETAEITAQAGGSSVTTNVYTSSGDWTYKQSATNLCFSTAGVHTLTLTGGPREWFLNWFTLERM